MLIAREGEENVLPEGYSLPLHHARRPTRSLWRFCPRTLAWMSGPPPPAYIAAKARRVPRYVPIRKG